MLSLVDVIDAVAPVELAGQSDNAFTRGALAGALNLMQLQMPDLYSALEATQPATAEQPAQRWLRIMLRAKERMSAEAKSQIITEVRRLAIKHFPGPSAASVTGFYVLLASLIQMSKRGSVADVWRGGRCIGLLLVFTLHSVRLR